MSSFEQEMEKIIKAQKDRQKREEERPRREFMKAAVAVGFTPTQAEFMWSFLSQEGHQHWNGRVD